MRVASIGRTISSNRASEADAARASPRYAYVSARWMNATRSSSAVAFQSTVCANAVAWSANVRAAAFSPSNEAIAAHAACAQTRHAGVCAASSASRMFASAAAPSPSSANRQASS